MCYDKDSRILSSAFSPARTAEMYREVFLNPRPPQVQSSGVRVWVFEEIFFWVSWRPGRGDAYRTLYISTSPAWCGGMKSSAYQFSHFYSVEWGIPEDLSCERDSGGQQQQFGPPQCSRKHCWKHWPSMWRQIYQRFGRTWSRGSKTRIPNHTTTVQARRLLAREARMCRHAMKKSSAEMISTGFAMSWRPMNWNFCSASLWVFMLCVCKPYVYACMHQSSSTSITCSLGPS